jgi:GT2 family glycosyltransferase
MISIIIPFFNRWDLTHQRLMDLHKWINEDVEVVLVNDASTDVEVEGGCAWWQKNSVRHTIKYRKNEENLGFGGSMNAGARVASGDILVFLSNDVVIAGDFIPQIKGILRANDKTLVGGRIIYWEAGWNQFEHKGKKFVIPYAEGWLLACTREIWDNLGGFDPLYGKYAVEDIDISTTAISLGYELKGLDNPHLRHIGGATATYDEHRMNYTIANKEKYIEKWQGRFEELFLGEGQ